MRISDWSSDVCSADLRGFKQFAHALSDTRMHPATATGEHRRYTAARANDVDRLLLVIDRFDAPGLASEQDALSDDQSLRDGQGAERLATGDDAEFFF